MRLFQNSGLSPRYRARFDVIAGDSGSFESRLSAFLSDRYGASHFLAPVLERDPITFFTNGDDAILQRFWAREHGLAESTPLQDILAAQIEEHKPEVFYNLDPMRFDGAFARRLPSCVKIKACWRAAPSPGADFRGYSLVLCNFPSIIAAWRDRGLRAEYLSPSYDPRMDDFAENGDRPSDLVFVGGYSRHHSRRADILKSVAEMDHRLRIRFFLDRSKLTSLAESPLGLVPPLRKSRRPSAVRRVSAGPVFGLELYKVLSSSKLVLNGAIDMAGDDRGNMRCFEALGCGALMISDAGRYPSGFVSGQTMLTYRTSSEAVQVIRSALDAWSTTRDIASKGHAMVRERYSKESQWREFKRIVDIA